MQPVPGADADDVGALLVEHGSIVKVVVRGRHAERLAKFGQRLRIRVGQRRDLHPVGLTPPGRVGPGDPAARDDPNSIPGHRSSTIDRAEDSSDRRGSSHADGPGASAASLRRRYCGHNPPGVPTEGPESLAWTSIM